LSSNQSNNG